jgi:hypothetical protein
VMLVEELVHYYAHFIRDVRSRERDTIPASTLFVRGDQCIENSVLFDYYRTNVGKPPRADFIASP